MFDPTVDPYERLRGFKPKLDGLTDHGLVLEPEDEATFRAYAEKHGVDFDDLRRQFEASHMVISNRQQGKLLHRQINRRIVPQNVAKDFFHGYLDGAIGTIAILKAKR